MRTMSTWQWPVLACHLFTTLREFLTRVFGFIDSGKCVYILALRVVGFFSAYFAFNYSYSK